MLRLLCVSLLALAACEGANAQPAPSPTPSSTAVAAASGASHTPAKAAHKASTDPAPWDPAQCAAIMTHARTCTAAFIPALVDARAAADVPAGIKAAVAEDRNGVIAQANQEWARDSTDAAIAAQCQQPKPYTDEQLAAATTCQASTDCTAFSQCFVALLQQSWTSR